MNLLDIVILILLLFAFLRGLFKGFVLELSGLVGIVISIYIAKHYTYSLSSFIESLFSLNSETAPIVTFLILFFVALLFFHFIAVLIDKFISMIALGWLNKILGGAISFIKYVLIISVLINIFSITNDNFDLINKTILNKSKLYSPIKSIVPMVLPFLDIDDLKSYIKKDE